MLNVNGAGRDGGPLGVRLTRLGRRIYGTAAEAPPDEAEGAGATTGCTASAPGLDGEPGTDIAAVDAGYVSVTPLRFDSTTRTRSRRSRAGTSRISRDGRMTLRHRTILFDLDGTLIDIDRR